MASTTLFILDQTNKKGFSMIKKIWLSLALTLTGCMPALADFADGVGELQSNSEWLDAVNMLILSMGSYDWVLWALFTLTALHFVAVIYVNLTDTPDDNTKYGKVYKNVIEPLAGALKGFKAKQKSFSELHSNNSDKTDERK